jgi:anti-sigma B factor antagonist
MDRDDAASSRLGPDDDPCDLALGARVGARGSLVTVAGALDGCSGPSLRDYLDRLLRQGEPRLVLQLGGLSFLDCAGLRALVAVSDATVRLGGWLRLHQVPASVRRVLALTGTDELLLPGAPHDGWPDGLPDPVS